MTEPDFANGMARATPGDGGYWGARKLYLTHGLQMSLVERLRAVEGMAATTRLLQQASTSKRSANG